MKGMGKSGGRMGGGKAKTTGGSGPRGTGHLKNPGAFSDATLSKASTTGKVKKSPGK